MLDINPTTDEWMILACDGIWNFMSSQEVLLNFISLFLPFQRLFLASSYAPWIGVVSYLLPFKVVDYVNKKIVNTPDDKLSSVCEEVTNEY